MKWYQIVPLWLTAIAILIILIQVIRFNVAVSEYSGSVYYHESKYVCTMGIKSNGHVGLVWSWK